MKLPGGVGDLQKGEQYMSICMVFRFTSDVLAFRYVNMDFFFFSVIKDSPLKHFNVSYDIVLRVA